jgi:molybdenum-dependent oxidoreductase-like protein
VPPGPIRLEGRAWSGWAPIERVEVGIDGVWHDAELGEPPGPSAWAPWWLDWDATPGDHVLSARAHDAGGRSQPDAPPWNVGGYSNNAIQRIPVTVR